MVTLKLKKIFYSNLFSKNFSKKLTFKNTNNTSLTVQSNFFLKNHVFSNFIFLKNYITKFIFLLEKNKIFYQNFFNTPLDNLAFFSFYKNFLFYKNFSKLFFINYVFNSNLFRNNVYIYDKHLFCFANRFLFLQHSKFRRFRTFKRYWVKMHLNNLRRLFPKSKKKTVRFKEFFFMTRFLWKKRIFDLRRRRYTRWYPGYLKLNFLKRQFDKKFPFFYKNLNISRSVEKRLERLQKKLDEKPFNRYRKDLEKQANKPQITFKFKDKRRLIKPGEKTVCKLPSYRMKRYFNKTSGERGSFVFKTNYRVSPRRHRDNLTVLFYKTLRLMYKSDSNNRNYLIRINDEWNRRNSHLNSTSQIKPVKKQNSIRNYMYFFLKNRFIFLNLKNTDNTLHFNRLLVFLRKQKKPFFYFFYSFLKSLNKRFKLGLKKFFLKKKTYIRYLKRLSSLIKFIPFSKKHVFLKFKRFNKISFFKKNNGVFLKTTSSVSFSFLKMVENSFDSVFGLSSDFDTQLNCLNSSDYNIFFYFEKNFELNTLNVDYFFQNFFENEFFYFYKNYNDYNWFFFSEKTFEKIHNFYNLFLFFISPFHDLSYKIIFDLKFVSDLGVDLFYKSKNFTLSKKFKIKSRLKKFIKIFNKASLSNFDKRARIMRSRMKKYQYLHKRCGSRWIVLRFFLFFKKNLNSLFFKSNFKIKTVKVKFKRKDNSFYLKRKNKRMKEYYSKLKKYYKKYYPNVDMSHMYTPKKIIKKKVYLNRDPNNRNKIILEKLIDKNVEFKKFFGTPVGNVSSKKATTSSLYLYNFFKKYSMNLEVEGGFLPKAIFSDNFYNIDNHLSKHTFNRSFKFFLKTFIFENLNLQQPSFKKWFFKWDDSINFNQIDSSFNISNFYEGVYIFSGDVLNWSKPKWFDFLKSISSEYTPCDFFQFVGLEGFFFKYTNFSKKGRLSEIEFEVDITIQLDTNALLPFFSDSVNEDDVSRLVEDESGAVLFGSPFPEFFSEDYDFLKQYIYLNFTYTFKRIKFRLFSNTATMSSAFLFGLFNKAYSFNSGRSSHKNFRRYRTFFLDQQKVDLSLFSNKTPYSALPEFFRVLIFRKIKGQTVPKFFKFFYLYITSFLEFFLKEKIFFRVIPIKKKINSAKRRLTRIFLKRRHFQSKVGRGFFLNEMLEILHLTFLYKDLNFLKRWFLLTMERIQFEKHRKFLSVFKHIVSKFPKSLMKRNKVKGFFLDVRGKVGVTGDAKKRNFFVSVGKRSKTTKNSKYDYQQGIVRTETGALGITMVMYY